MAVRPRHEAHRPAPQSAIPVFPCHNSARPSEPRRRRPCSGCTVREGLGGELHPIHSASRAPLDRQDFEAHARPRIPQATPDRGARRSRARGLRDAGAPFLSVCAARALPRRNRACEATRSIDALSTHRAAAAYPFLAARLSRAADRRPGRASGNARAVDGGRRGPRSAAAVLHAAALQGDRAQARRRQASSTAPARADPGTRPSHRADRPGARRRASFAAAPSIARTRRSPGASAHRTSRAKVCRQPRPP